jgi:SagB-type dehydrogenase family enzyme
MDTVSTPASQLLSPEQQDLWNRVNDTGAEIPATTVWAMFAEHAAAQPDRPAVITARRVLTYGELAGLAAAIAAQLAAAGRRGPVGICVEPGWEQVAAVLGALAAGVPFHPVDPGLRPAARWGSLSAAGAVAVLTQSWLEERLTWPDDLPRIPVDSVSATGTTAAPAPVTPDPVACLLAPEAAGPLAPVTTEALVQTIADLAGRFSLGRDDRVLAVSALGSDVSVCAIAALLGAGGGIVIPDDIDLHAPPAWATLMQREQVTIWHSPPALAAELAEHLQIRGEGVPPALRLLLLGGEPLTPALAGRLRQLVGPDVQLANLGGVIAGGLWVSCQEVGEAEQRRGHVPVGLPLANKHLYVLSETLAPCPVWVTGRVYLGGRGLPGSSPDPAGEYARHPQTGEQLLRTHLTGRLLPDGVLDVVADDQARITVAGHPLNLRDVEAALAGHEAVLTAAVVPAGEGSVAYVKPAPGAGVTGAELMKYLGTRMSPYLLPASVELVYALPITPGGRIDRTALSGRASAAVEQLAGPATAAGPASLQTGPDDSDLAGPARALAAEILGVADVDAATNLLDLGATSVQLVRLAVQAEQELGIQVDVEELLRFPSVAVLLSFAEPGSPETAAGQPAADGTGAPAAPGVPQVPTPAGEQAAPRDAPPALILDPVDRMTFTDSRRAIRRDLDDEPAVNLVRPPGAREALGRRATVRTFSPEPVTAAAFGSLLRVLGSLGPGTSGLGGAQPPPKYAYPSAGSLYPVQAYVTVGAGRVDGVPAGAYYYHPVRHRLSLVTADAITEAAAHAWVNRGAFRSSAFTISLIADLDAITPMYGVRARDYSLVEAGAMCQLLMTAAADLGLGLCPVGEMDFDRVRGHYRLGARQELLHALLAGLPAPPDGGAEEAAMLQRVGQLAAGEVEPR